MIVLDTHAWIWWSVESRRLSRRALRAIEEMDAVGVPAIACYETARLVARGRIAFTIPVREWLERALARPRVRLLEITPEIAASAATLEWRHQDPADRLIVATVIALGARVVTKDERIRRFPPARAVW